MVEDVLEITGVDGLLVLLSVMALAIACLQKAVLYMMGLLVFLAEGSARLLMYRAWLPSCLMRGFSPLASVTFFFSINNKK